MAGVRIVVEESEGPFVVAIIYSSIGKIKILAEAAIVDDYLVLEGLHVHGVDTSANAFGPGRLRSIIRDIADELQVNGIDIRGAVRTTGANSGHRPRRIRVVRKPASESEGS